MQFMNDCAWISRWKTAFLFSVLLLLRPAHAEPAPGAVAAFDAYQVAVEDRLALRRASGQSMLATSSGGVAETSAKLTNGAFVVERVVPEDAYTRGATANGALLHDWRGTAFVAGAKAADFIRIMQDFDRYPERFAPQIEQARVMRQQGDAFDVSMRIRQKHVITVVMDGDYSIRFGRVDARRGYSVSRSTRIVEITSAGTREEHALNSKEEHGFLWRLNTYWSYEERDGGLYLQVEAISLTRAIPTGLGWVIGPYVESIPRESVEFTLRAVEHALRR
jgi:hypothetical protein